MALGGPLINLLLQPRSTPVRALRIRRFTFCRHTAQAKIPAHDTTLIGAGKSHETNRIARQVLIISMGRNKNTVLTVVFLFQYRFTAAQRLYTTPHLDGHFYRLN